MSSTTPTGWPRRPRARRCSRCSARAIWRSPSISRPPANAIRASCRSTARRWREAAQSYFIQSEQIPTLVRIGIRRDADGTHVAGGLFLQHLPEGEDGRERLHTRLDHPEWEHVAALGADDGRATSSPIPRCRWRRWSGGCSTRRRTCASSPRVPLARGCRCTPDYIASVLAQVLRRGAAGDGRRERYHNRRLRLLRDEVSDHCLNSAGV